MGDMEIDIGDLQEASCDETDLALVDFTFAVQFLMANEFTANGFVFGR
jgi:hypothetical protein